MKIEVQSNSEFLKSSDLNDGDTITIISEAKQEYNEKFDRDVVRATIEIPSGDRKVMTMNAQSVRAMVSMYGDESTEWVGKEVEVEKAKVSVGGKMVEAIFIKEVINQ